LSENAWQEGALVSIIFSPFGDEFVTSSTLGLVVHYDAGCAVPERIVIETGKPRMVDVKFIADETRLIARSADRIEVWDALEGTQQTEFLVDNDKGQNCRNQ
jgi:hypothetical protein